MLGTVDEQDWDNYVFLESCTGAINQTSWGYILNELHHFPKSCTWMNDDRIPTKWPELRFLWIKSASALLSTLQQLGQVRQRLSLTKNDKGRGRIQWSIVTLLHLCQCLFNLFPQNVVGHNVSMGKTFNIRLVCSKIVSHQLPSSDSLSSKKTTIINVHYSTVWFPIFNKHLKSHPHSKCSTNDLWLDCNVGLQARKISSRRTLVSV